MSQQTTPSMSASSVPASTPALSWIEAWTLAITRPSVATYERIANSVSASSNTAYLWIFITAAITSIIRTIVLSLFYGGGTTGGTTTVPGAGLIGLVCAPVVGIVAVVIIAIFTAITQAVAGALGGTGNYTKLIYTSTAFSALLSMIGAILSMIPVVNLLTIPLGLYGLVLHVLAVKAVNQFGWGKAILVAVVFWVVVFAVIAVIFLAVVGTAFSNIYTNIMQGITGLSGG